MGKYDALFVEAPASPAKGKYAALFDLHQIAPKAPEASNPFGSLAENEQANKQMGADFSEFIDKATPVGSVKEIYGQLSGDRPGDSTRAGLAAVDIASAGLAGKLKMAGAASEMGMAGIKQALAGGAGAGAASLAAEKMGAPGWLQFVAGLGGGMGGAKLGGAPEMGMKTVSREVETPAFLKARELQKYGYPVTQSHVTPGDFKLKQAMGMPELAGESKAYQDKLDNAMRGDVGNALGVGAETTQTLGERAKDLYNSAKNQMGAKYKEMLGQADNQRGPEMTGVGELTHAGKNLEKGIYADLAAQGLKITPDMKARALGVLDGAKPLGFYDMPSGSSLNPDDVTAAIKFADLAGQKAPSAVSLNELARNFADSEGIFSRAGGPGANRSGFLRNIKNKATDMAGDLIKKRDEARGVANTAQADFPKWNEQRANWAKHADLVDQFNGKMGSAKTRGTSEKVYSAEEISPEQLFTKEFKGAGVLKINEFKQFLKDNGQDPAIMENMAKDWLNDVGKSADPNAGFNAIAREWENLIPEKKAALFSPKTADAISAAIERGRSARQPLEVMGMQAKGNSVTAPKTALDRLLRTSPISGNEAKGAAIGGTIGTLAGGPGVGFGGATLGGYVGGKVDASNKAKAIEAARALLTNGTISKPMGSASVMAPRLLGPQSAAIGATEAITLPEDASKKARKLSKVGK